MKIFHENSDPNKDLQSNKERKTFGKKHKRKARKYVILNPVSAVFELPALIHRDTLNQNLPLFRERVSKSVRFE